MPVALTQPETVTAPLAPPRKVWTRAECEALEERGLLTGQHLELIEGELINKMGKKLPHVSAVTLLKAWLVGVFGIPFVIQEAPVDVAPEDNPTNEPEPDIIVLKREVRSFAPDEHFQPDDLHLVVEVADSTLRFDRTVKARLYARAQIAEYWVVDVKRQRLIVHRDPDEGAYHSILAFGPDETVSPLAAPQAQARMSDILS